MSFQQKSRRAFAIARRAAVSICSALAIVFIASRINRPAPPLLISAPRPGDELLKDVTLDMRSLRTALDSLRASTRTKIVIEEKTLAQFDPSSFAQAEKPLHLRNVHLSSALAIILERSVSNGALILSENAGGVIIAPPGEMLRPVYLRMYDIRDLIHTSVEEDAAVVSNMQQQQQRASFSTEDEINQSLERLLKETAASSDPYAFDTEWSLQIWSGRLFVNASDIGHRDIEKMLLMLRGIDTLSKQQAKARP